MTGQGEVSPAGLQGAGPEPPLPPLELRRLVTHDDAFFAIPRGAPAIGGVPDSHFEAVFDFGCGCGRVARQLMCQQPKPRRYLGVDIHPGMIAWCRDNLTPVDPAFRFEHHDVWNLGLGPTNTRQRTAPFSGEDSSFTLVNAHSVFTHLCQDQTEFYLGECARLLRPGGIARTTWFLFDKATFPMMFDFQACLFINDTDPTNAVIYDWRWLVKQVWRRGLGIRQVIAPAVRGFQWEIYFEKGAPAGRFPGDAKTLAALCGSGLAAGQPSAEPAAGPSAAPLETAAVAAAPPPLAEDARATAPGASRPAHSLARLTYPDRVRLLFPPGMSREEFGRRTGELHWWYHSYYFDNGYEVRGDYDIGADVASYGFPETMEGLRVLDIGTGGGWFAHFFEQLGAQVTTVDARGYCDFDVYGRHEYSQPAAEGRRPDRWTKDGRPVYDSPVSRAFWIMREILGSNVRFVNARVYDVAPELFPEGPFDIVFMGAILCHLRDPVGALMAARSVCKGKLIATTPVVIGEPEAETPPRQYLPYVGVDKISWWLPNEACFRNWLLAAGFDRADVSRQVSLHGDIIRMENGRASNGDQLLRAGVGYAG